MTGNYIGVLVVKYKEQILKFYEIY